jgi:hypothetical protein
MGSDATRTLALAGVTLVAAFAVLTAQTLRIPAQAPGRLVAELRLAQVGAVLLSFSAALLAGLSAAHDAVPGAGLDVAFAVLFCGLALMTLLRDAGSALAWLAGGFATRALLDLLHLAGWLPGPVSDQVIAGSALANGLAVACCVAPLVHRGRS